MVGERFSVTDELADIPCCLAHILGSLVTIGDIVQNAVFQHVVFKIGGIELTYEGTVHVEGGNTVFQTDIVGRLRVGHILDIILQGRQRLTLVPRREIVLLCRGHYRVVFIVTRYQYVCAA